MENTISLYDSDIVWFSPEAALAVHPEVWGSECSHFRCDLGVQCRSPSAVGLSLRWGERDTQSVLKTR